MDNQINEKVAHKMRNAVRIVCDPVTGSISYFFRNEMG